ncbi:MAG: hypothetical protein US89_C0005G0117 [Candidatus Peregrinibacteria bacterium GW2011_GWF2_38_29]|nr:MAG: hypothetical protein US89_C0005G0117 [Candidatus Peregrinibacteria bacterium GW2011_GWF2_38_29]HBB02703.1 hypothetical protein [Candidatus Peregrinibacteria bacterium]
MDIKGFFKSKAFRFTIYGIITFIIALLIFQAGMFMGFHRAGFSYKWGEDYYRNFGGRREAPLMMDRMRGGFLDSNGVTGKIVKISLPIVTVLDKDNAEKVIVIKDDTAIRSMRDSFKATDLKVDDFIVVIGSPDDSSQIEAKLIRVMPEPPVVDGKFDDKLPPLAPFKK